MSEQQIQDGYDRLGGALAPPVDTLERVGRRVGARRRRRRVALGGAAALALVATGGGVLAATGGDGDDPGGVPVATEAPPVGPQSTLVLTRPDGSTYDFPDVTVTCEPPRTAAGDVFGEGTGRIWAYSPIAFTGTEENDDIVVTQPFVYVEAIADKADGRDFTLPADAASDRRAITLFVADLDGNEVSSAEYETAGTVRVLRASCDPVPVLELEVDTTLGSEVEQQTLWLAGALTQG